MASDETTGIETALDGLVVTELGGRTGAGFCGALLAQLGATVVVVEGRKARPYRPQLLAGKLSLFAGPSDDAILNSLLVRSDVVLLSSDVDPTHQLPVADVPGGPVLCDLTAFGTDGTFAGLAWSDLQIQALSGICDTTGHADGPPVAIGLPITDVLAGTYAAGAVLAALRVRRMTGCGQSIDMALFDCAFVALNSFLGGVLGKRATDRSRLGNRHPTVAPWNLYRSADGWILICAGNQGQWQRLCGLMGRPDFVDPPMTQADRITRVAEIDAAIETWTGGLSTAACMSRLVDAAIACGPIAPIAGHPREANLEHRDMIGCVLDPVAGASCYVPASPFRMSRTPGRAPARIPAPDADRPTVLRLLATPASTQRPAGRRLTRPLEGLRVVEIGQYTTAPLSARQLAHLGAEVIKVEQPGGDELRTWVPHLDGQSISFRLNNADKRSLVLNLRTPEGQDVLARLLETADILVENLKPGTLARFGFSPARLAALNARLVYCAITGFGADSIYASRPAFDMVIQAMSGFMAAVAPDAVPLKSGISTADTMGAEMAIVAMLAAIEYRDRTGHGQYIDLSMQDVSAWLTQTAWNGAVPPSAAMLEVADGYILAEASPSSAREALGYPVPLTRVEATSRLSDAGIRAAPVLAVRESAALKHTHDRGLWTMIEDGGANWPALACPLRLRATPPRLTRLSPAVDADGADILASLGLPAHARAPTEPV